MKKRMKKIFLVFVMLDLIFANSIFLSPTKSLAADPSAFNSDKLWPMSGTTSDWGKLTTVHHSFKINSSPHQVNYTKKAYKTVTSPTPHIFLFLKLADSNYFSVSGEYYLGFDAATRINHRMYRKALSETEKNSDQAIKISDSEIFFPADPAGGNLQKDYMNYMNSNPSFAQAYTDKFEWMEEFFTATTYNVDVTPPGATAPTITLSGSTEKNRPKLVFKLTFVGGWSGALSAENNNFYFTFDPSLTPDAKAKEIFTNVALKITQNGEGHIVEKSNDGNQLEDHYFQGGTFQQTMKVVVNRTKWWDTIVNRVYNATDPTMAKFCGKVTSYDGGKGVADPKYDETVVPNRQCINTSSGGYLDKWGVKYVKGSLSNPAGTDEQNECGSTALTNLVTKGISYILTASICNFGLTIHKFFVSLLNYAVSQFENITIGRDF